LPAAKHLERICERIERENPEAARRVARPVTLKRKAER
jgi:plasmid stabilization system protein ParE